MINWYPGHMTKSIRMIEENLKLVDAILYVLDSRAPYSCINPNFNSLIQGMPTVYVLNKAELGSRSEVNDWLKYLSTDKSAAIACTGTSSNSTAPLVGIIKKLCEKRLEKYKAKGVKITLKAMVLGVPNTGKSTIINSLCGSARALTGNMPGVTRGKQWVKINDFLELLDTPGTLYPKLSDQTVAKHLAYLGSIKDQVVDVVELAIELIKELEEINSNILINRYNVSLDGKEVDVLERIAISRGFILRGSLPDIDRAASAILDDFRKGRMGQITLDQVSKISL